MTAPARYGTRHLPVAWTLNGQSLTGGPDPQGRRWLVGSVRGWRGSAPPRNRVTARSNASGALWGAPYRDARVITLADARVRCPSPAVRADTEELLAALIPDRDDVDLVPLVRRGENGIAQVRYVGLDDPIDPIPVGPHWIDYDIQLIAPDPRKFAAAWETAEAGPRTDGVGGIVSTGAGIVSTGTGVGAGIAGTPSHAAVAGGGTAANPVVVELPAGSTNVIVGDGDGTSRVRYRGTIPAGMSVFVNCDSQPAYDVPGAPGPIPGYRALLGTSDATSAVTVHGAWPRLAPGQGARYAVVAGDMPAGSVLRVHTRPTWD